MYRILIGVPAFILGVLAMSWTASWAIRIPVVIVCWMLGDFIGDRLDSARQQRKLDQPTTERTDSH
jgi:hypothetical protein